MNEIINEAKYKQFQKLLTDRKAFRLFWQFWSNYAFVFFAIAFLILATSYDFHAAFGEILILSIFSFLIARGILVTIINLSYERTRPYQRYNFVPITSKFFSFKTRTPNSFPSRHTTAYFSVVAVVSLFVPALGAALFAVAILAGMGRIVLGYHWPSDIFAGMVLGLLVGYLTVLFGYSIIFT
jgi:undecaprenyl-diphosphatase